MAEISLEDSTQDIDLELKHLPLSVSDRATSEDMLSYKEFTEPIANRIAQLTDEDIPITIGIFGEWGSGKTSFLKMLSDDLKKNSIDPIWFDAWKYDREDNLWSALLQCILNHIKINGNWHERQLIRIKLWVKTLRLKRGSSEIIKNTLSFFIKFTITFLFILLLFKFFLAFFNGIPPSLAELEAILKSISLSDLKVYYVFIALVVSFIIFKPDAFLNLFNSNINIDMSKFSEKSSYHDHIAYLDNFSEEFKNILKLVNNKNKPIVIIIDDLDRCLPEKALHILEGIKLFLDIEPCVYLLALDREFVEKIVLSKFKGLRIDKDSIRKLSEGYIEKFVQLQIAVPPIDKSIAKDFIKEMYSKIDENHSEHIAEILTSVVPPNPRKLKNILRTYVLMKMLADEKSKIEICPILLAKIVVIQSQFKELYRQIIEDPELLTEIERTVLEIKGIIKPEDYQKNDKFSEIAQSYLNKYSQLNEIFKDGNVGKRFIDCDSEVYIFFLRKLSSIIDDDKTDELQGDLKLPHLKIGELSDFGPLPPGSRLPFANNAVFTGRENELLKLANYLLHENRDANDEIRAAAVITGLEGIGKTQVAVEFCYRYGRFFQGVHWIQADRGISQEVAECGAAMSLDRWPDKTSEQAALTFKVWSEEKMHLLVVDNIEHIEDAQYLISSIPQTRLLLTSRRQNWPADLGIKVLPLDVLSNSQSKDLLRKLAPRLTDVPDKDLDLLTTRLYGHPLALDLAGRYLDDRSDLSLESYMDELQKCDSALEHVSLRNWVNHSPTKHMTRLETAFSLSWDQLAMDTVDELARCILRACGYCAPNTPIPLGIIKKIWVSKASDEEINRAVGRLSRLSLITITDKGPNLLSVL